MVCKKHLSEKYERLKTFYNPEVIQSFEIVNEALCITAAFFTFTFVFLLFVCHLQRINQVLKSSEIFTVII